MTTTVPAVKSLLVRARMSLAEATQSRLLTCGDVRLELAEAAEGLRKASGPVRQHVRRCDPCREYRAQLRSNGRALAALAPAGLLVWLHKALGIKLGTSGSAGGAGAAGGSGAAAGGVAAAGGSAAIGGAAAGGGAVAGGVGGALGAKAAAGVATAALLTAGAVEVKQIYSGERDGEGSAAALRADEPKHPGVERHVGHGVSGGVAATKREPAPVEAKVTPVPAEDDAPAPPHQDIIGPAAGGVGLRRWRAGERQRHRRRRGGRDL